MLAGNPPLLLRFSVALVLPHAAEPSSADGGGMELNLFTVPEAEVIMHAPQTGGGVPKEHVQKIGVCPKAALC